jgi:hypothetical protein
LKTFHHQSCGDLTFFGHRDLGDQKISIAKLHQLKNIKLPHNWRWNAFGHQTCGDQIFLIAKLATTKFFITIGFMTTDFFASSQAL